MIKALVLGFVVVGSVWNDFQSFSGWRIFNNISQPVDALNDKAELAKPKIAICFPEYIFVPNPTYDVVKLMATQSVFQPSFVHINHMTFDSGRRPAGLCRMPTDLGLIKIPERRGRSVSGSSVLTPYELTVADYIKSDIFSGRLASVLELEHETDIELFGEARSIHNFAIIKGQVGPSLRLTNASRIFSHNLSGAQRGEDQNDRTNAQDQTRDSGNAHNASKYGHLLLSVQILLGSLMITGGFYLLMNTVPNGWRIESETFLLNCIFGVLVMIFGCLLCTYALLG